jgi:hypothetical protein
MPQETRRGRAVWTPRARASRECVGRWSRTQLPQLAHRLEQREIGGREDIRTTQREEQITLSRPRSNTMKCVERGRGVNVREHRERIEIERLLLELRRERCQVGGLLSRHAQRTQSRFAEHGDIRGRHHSGRIRDPRVHRARLRERDLLLEHEKDESFEPWLAWPEWRRAVPLHDVRESRLAARERADSASKRALVQWGDGYAARSSRSVSETNASSLNGFEKNASARIRAAVSVALSVPLTTMMRARLPGIRR